MSPVRCSPTASHFVATLCLMPFCPKCATKCEDTAIVCIACAAPLPYAEEAPMTTWPQSVEDRSKGSMFFASVIAAVVVILAIFVLVVIGSMINGK